MNILRDAMQTALATQAMSSPVVGTSPAQIWITLTPSQKDRSVYLFREHLKNNDGLAIGFNQYEDLRPADNNRVETFYFGASFPDDALMQVRLLQQPVRVSRQISHDDCVFENRSYACAALMTHQDIQVNPTTGLKFCYLCEIWLTVEGVNALMNCMLQSMKKEQV